MNHTRYRKYELRSDVEKVDLESGVRYVIPFDRDTVYSVFDSINRAIRCLKSIADNTDDDSYNSSLVYARRRFGRIFRHPYQYELDERKIWKLPTVGKIHTDIVWHNGIDPRTFVLRKTTDSLILEYMEGFQAKDEILSIGKNETDKLKYSSIKSCGSGVKHTHAPFEPSIFEKWRYNPSRLAFSIKSDSGNLKLGIDNKPPEKPLWYRTYEPITVTGGPYSYATFDMENQTSVVKFVHNRNYDKKI
jgi:hypothetical protein